MSKGLIIGLSSVGLALLLVVFIFLWGVGVYNKEVGLANRYDAQFSKVETSLDNMRKAIKNKYKVTDKFAKDFIAVAVTQAAGRKGGSLLKFNTEAANKLGIDPEMYMDISNTISGQLAAFHRSQNELTDIWREHKTLCEQLPASVIIGSKIKEKPVMISSTEAKDIIQSKTQNDDLLPE